MAAYSDCMNNFQYVRRVNLADTDAATIAHFTSILAYAEEAEHELLRSIGFPISVSPDGYGWPRVHCELSVDAPLGLGEIVVLRPTVEAIGRSSVSWCWDLTRQDGGEHVALVRMTTVCVQRTTGSGAFSSVSVPDEIREALVPYLASR